MATPPSNDPIARVSADASQPPAAPRKKESCNMFSRLIAWWFSPKASPRQAAPALPAKAASAEVQGLAKPVLGSGVAVLPAKPALGAERVHVDPRPLAVDNRVAIVARSVGVEPSGAVGPQPSARPQAPSPTPVRVLDNPDDEKEAPPTQNAGASASAAAAAGIPLALVAQGVERRVAVPDDGSCLFYSLCIGIRKQYAQSEAENHPEVQAIKAELDKAAAFKKPAIQARYDAKVAEVKAAYAKIQKELGWNEGLDQYNYDPGQKGLAREAAKAKAQAFLRVPADTLRVQAYAWLMANKAQESVGMVLMEGILSHNEVYEKKVRDSKGVIALLETEINLLEKEIKKIPGNKDLKDQLAQKQQQVKDLTAALREEEGMIVADINTDKYLEKSTDSKFFCGTAQIYALSALYGVPIQVIGNHGMRGAFTLPPINPTNSKAPPLKLALVKGNHFDYLSS